VRSFCAGTEIRRVLFHHQTAHYPARTQWTHYDPCVARFDKKEPSGRNQLDFPSSVADSVSLVQSKEQSNWMRSASAGISRLHDTIDCVGGTSVLGLIDELRAIQASL
jgi:hypothetical protein